MISKPRLAEFDELSRPRQIGCQIVIGIRGPLPL